MKGFQRFFLGLTAGMFLLVIGLFWLANGGKNTQIDVVTFNDDVQTVKEYWDHLDEMKDTDLESELMVLDQSGEVLYVTMEGAVFQDVHSVYDALKKDMICVPVTQEQVFLGTVVFQRPSRTGYQAFLRKAFVFSGVMTGILVLFCLSFMIYVNFNIARPFYRMKAFAAKIAQGELEEPLAMEKSNLFGIFTESFDIMREELKASRNRELALKIKEKELVASLSHDLKTPVTGIRLICELLAVKVQDEYIKGKLQNIEQKTEEINILISDLLSSALEELGEMKVNCCDVASDILKGILELHDPHKKVVAREIPGCILHVDQHRLSQVIGNVISNSYKYANTEITVNYQFDGKYLEMTIQDRGRGVSPEELPLLTNKFYRGKDNTSGKEGSGLGLYISNELMKKMHGALICASNEEGFCVILKLPLA